MLRTPHHPPPRSVHLGDHLGHRSVFILHPHMFIVGYENQEGVGGGETLSYYGGIAVELYCFNNI